ncbi:MMPL family transporter [Virgibacillus proomii]|uniref:MMPL family transporter n=1 Tax=Virgibacillus proomii TaxID=84407 RepID=UPI001C0FEBAC|nr:MMPL family transporter [Virgibacillus proomii]MBU5266307.1 MMPL family transporter [Virgibacillus proomii]
MKQIIKLRWYIAALWLIAATALFFLAPSLQELVREKGQITVPEGAPSEKAQELLDAMSPEAEDATSGVLVFHEEDGLTKDDRKAIEKGISTLKENKEELGVSDILDFREDPAIKDQTVSKDGTTILVPFQVSLEDQKILESRTKILNAVDDIQVDHHLTGEQYIEQDIIKNSEEGLKKTEIITVALILIILFVVFKSLVAPFIPLLTIGISYLAAQGIVAILADTVGFPLSTFTQIFMVAVMFGIGTDYCILLISRFKEEIQHQDSIKEAVVKTYKSGGKTILFAGLAVLIGFSTIGLSTFSLYQSAVAVAIGVAVVLLALATLVPFFLVVLGKKLFWPFDKNVEHKESKLWKMAGNFSWTRPLLSLLIVAIITAPFLITYNGDKSYDSLDEMGDNYGSKIAFNWIADSFGPSQTMPLTVVYQLDDEKIDTTEDFQTIAMLTEELAKQDEVDQVRSATRPAGNVIPEFLVDEQTSQLANGIGKSTDGIQEIEKGLRDAASEIKNASPQLEEAQSGVDQLLEGTSTAENGVGELSSALTEIQKGIESGSKGTGEIRQNLQMIKDNLDETIAANKQLLKGYQAIADGLKGFGSGKVNTEQLNTMINTLKDSKQRISTMHQIAIEANPELQTNMKYMESHQRALGQIDGIINGVNDMKTNLNQLSQAQNQLKQQVITPLNQLNEGFQQSISGQEQLSKGIGELLIGIDQLQTGLNQAADGQNQVNSNIPSLQQGLSQLYGGQKQLKTAFSDIEGQLDKLAGGLTEASNGLQEIDKGLSEVKNYLGEIKTKDSNPIVVIPDQALENEDFMEGANQYLSEDKSIVKFEVLIEQSPYSTEAIQMVDKVKQVADDAATNTIFADSEPYIGGVSSTNNDLQNISNEDYSRTVIIMLSGLFIMLIFLLRSFVMPIYLIGSLILTYVTSMGVAELIFTQLFGYDGLTWAIPFFAFVMLMALGIDYSIFLMDRFNEYKEVPVKEALIHSMKNMGTVVISAAIILGGTFGAMLPSGVLSLLQIATVVLTGLFLYAFIVLPLFIPVMVRLFGKNNWWPFKHHAEQKRE